MGIIFIRHRHDKNCHVLIHVALHCPVYCENMTILIVIIISSDADKKLPANFKTYSTTRKQQENRSF